MDVFRGGTQTLKNVLKIVCEVEFVPHYENQPLFGDVCRFLELHNLMFNKFLDLCGRALRPVTVNGKLDAASQHIWSDAIFIHHVQKMQSLTDTQLLKLSLFACVYQSMDLFFYCLQNFNRRNKTSLSEDWLNRIKF